GGPVLVALAAGIGSRYGGLKQMDRLGNNGEVLLDYSVFDAVRSGFEKIVFIIRRDIEADFREQLLAGMGSKVRWEFAYQEQDSLIPPGVFEEAQKAGRVKPWGTCHALLCAADNIDGPFAVINADDFYGREAFAVMGAHLGGAGAGEPAIVPYRLDKTLSPKGTVARGICEIKDGYLVSVEELTAIERKNGGIFNTNPDGALRELAADSPASMNFWGFPPSVLPLFREYFTGFLQDFAADIPGQIKSECYIPRAADYFIKQGTIKIKALSANSEWFGVTYREDREDAMQKLENLTRAGVYPASLW
ncbi:MAG: hypothetical protein FWH38_02085, partial [Treponema sp.]|nr:hypothetical protein [Treponema sp.]